MLSMVCLKIVVAGRDSEDTYKCILFLYIKGSYFVDALSVDQRSSEKWPQKQLSDFFGSLACSVYVEIWLQAEEVDTRWSAEKAQLGAELLKYTVIVAEESEIN